MSPKAERFVTEYLIDLNATQAAIRAGYSAKTANEQGSRLLTNVSVRYALQEAMKARAERTEIKADRVLKELARIAFFDVRRLFNEDGSMKLAHELDDEAAACVAGMETSEINAGENVIGQTKKVKIVDKGGALTLAMRHLGMLRDRLEVEDVTDRSEQMRQRREQRIGARSTR